MLALWGAAAAAILNRRGTPFFLALLAWQGAVYSAAPYMSWLNQHTQLTPELELRRRTELRRERVADVTRYTVGTAATTAILVGVFTLIAAGGSNPGHPRNPFTAAHASARGLPAREQRTPETTPTNPNGSPASTNSGGAAQPVAAPRGGGPGVRPQSGGAGPATTTPATTPGSAPVATTTASTPASTPPTTTRPAPTTTAPAPTTTAPASVTTTVPAPTSTTAPAPRAP